MSIPAVLESLPQLDTGPEVPAAPKGRGPLAVRSFGLTHPGKVRGSNEDQFLVAELAKTLCVRSASVPGPQTQHSAARGHLFLVADGMGGHQAGEEASALAVNTVEEFALNTMDWVFHLNGSLKDQATLELQHALRRADTRVRAAAAADPGRHGMGTTLTLAVFLDPHLFVFHAGDSRCYLLRGGLLYQLTRDHTFVEQLVRHGHIDAKTAATHQMRHVIVNAVGGHDEDVEVETHKLELAAGDALLLCSDGLTEMVPNETLAAVLAATDDPRRACEELVARANEAGGKDNVTVVVARFG